MTLIHSQPGTCYFCDLILTAQRIFVGDHPDPDEGPCDLCFLAVAVDAFAAGVANHVGVLPIPMCAPHHEELASRLRKISAIANKPLPVRVRGPVSPEELAREKEPRAK